MEIVNEMKWNGCLKDRLSCALNEWNFFILLTLLPFIFSLFPLSLHSIPKSSNELTNSENNSFIKNYILCVWEAFEAAQINKHREYEM